MLVREAVPGDSDRCAEIHRTAMAEMLYLPPDLHTAEEVRAWMRNLIIPRQRVWVAEIDGRLVGYAALGDRFLNSLYVAPGYQGRGVGSALLQRVKVAAPEGFSLWTLPTQSGRHPLLRAPWLPDRARDRRFPQRGARTGPADALAAAWARATIWERIA